MIHIYRITLDLSYRTFSTNTSITRGHTHTQAFQAMRQRSNLFAIKSIDAWNNLPECVIKAHSVDIVLKICLVNTSFYMRLLLTDLCCIVNFLL